MVMVQKKSNNNYNGNNNNSGYVSKIRRLEGHENGLALNKVVAEELVD